MCIKLANIHSLTHLFKKLKFETFDYLFKSDTPACSRDNLYTPFEKVLFKLVILRGHEIQLTRPYLTQIAVRVSDSSGKIIGQTKSLTQSIKMEWNDEMYGISSLKDDNLKLFFEIIQQVPDSKKEFFFARGTFEVKVGDGTETLHVGAFGKLEAKLTVYERFTKDFSEKVIQQHLKVCEEKMRSTLASQVRLTMIIDDKALI